MPITLLVASTADIVDGDVSSADALAASPGADGISLREAILALDALPGAYTIAFAPALAGGTIAVASPLPGIEGTDIVLQGLEIGGEPAVTIDFSALPSDPESAYLVIHASQIAVYDLRLTWADDAQAGFFFLADGSIVTDNFEFGGIGSSGSDDITVAGSLEGAGDAGSGAEIVVAGSSGDGNPEAGSGMATLLGTSLSDTLIGGLGADSIVGQGGNDLARGNQGSDTLRGGAGDDDLGAGQDGDFVYAGYGSDLLRGGPGDDALRGGPDSDTLSAGQGDDTLFGGQGDDLLQGRAGNDFLAGGPGADRFWFGHAGAADADTIADFVPGEDRIELDAGVFTALAGGALAQESFLSAAGVAAQSAGQFVLYDSATGNLYYDADGSGEGAAALVATLVGVPALGAGDILVA